MLSSQQLTRGAVGVLAGGMTATFGTNLQPDWRAGGNGNVIDYYNSSVVVQRFAVDASALFCFVHCDEDTCTVVVIGALLHWRSCSTNVAAIELSEARGEEPDELGI